jgi:hypothetical protein
MEKWQKARAERRGYSRGVGRNQYVESPHNPSGRISPKPPRTRSVRISHQSDCQQNMFGFRRTEGASQYEAQNSARAKRE